MSSNNSTLFRNFFFLKNLWNESCRNWWHWTWAHKASSETWKVRPIKNLFECILELIYLFSELNKLVPPARTNLITWFDIIYAFFLLDMWRIFDVWCLHIPAKDRTTFTGSSFFFFFLNAFSFVDLVLHKMFASSGPHSIRNSVVKIMWRR